MSTVSILIVDDDDDVRAALFDELSRDYRVEAATCGREAFAALAARTFDAVISDLKMPDHDGIEVLDFARAQDPEVIRILLTGYVDERAHAALLRPDAPFKVGKPWYDEIEVTLRRALEQRRRTQELSSSLESACSLGEIEAQLTPVATLVELGEVLTLQIARLSGVEVAWATIDGSALVGAPVEPPPGAWKLDRAVDAGGRLLIGCVGTGASAGEIIERLIHLGRHQAAQLKPGPTGPEVRRSRMQDLMHHATVGAMASSLLHDLASTLQVIDGAVGEIVERVAAIDPELQAAADDVARSTREVLDGFIATRRLLAEGAVTQHRVAASEIVERVLRHVGARVRSRCELVVTMARGFELETSPALLVRALSTILGVASDLAQAGSRVELAVRADHRDVEFVISHPGPGLAPELVPSLFEPLAWNRPTELPIGLAIAAHAARAFGATVRYRRDDDGAGRFLVALPCRPV